jgi:hypothetical protein
MPPATRAGVFMPQIGMAPGRREHMNAWEELPDAALVMQSFLGILPLPRTSLHLCAVVRMTGICDVNCGRQNSRARLFFQRTQLAASKRTNRLCAAPLGLNLYSCVPRPHGLGSIISCPLRGTLLSCNCAKLTQTFRPGLNNLCPLRGTLLSCNYAKLTQALRPGSIMPRLAALYLHNSFRCAPCQIVLITTLFPWMRYKTI